MTYFYTTNLCALCHGPVDPVYRYRHGIGICVHYVPAMPGCGCKPGVCMNVNCPHAPKVTS